jgi:hypothetical protein
MSYLTIKPTQIIEVLKEQISAREQEVFGYQTNIENFKRLLDKLPTDEKPDTSDWKLSAKYDFRDDIRQRLINEVVQQERSFLVLGVLIDQLPPAELKTMQEENKQP